MSNVKQQESQKHWSQMQERGTFLGLQIFLFIYKLFGRKVLNLFLFPVVVYLYFTAGSRRHASLDYLKRVAALQNWEKPVTHRTGIKHFYSFSQSALDKVDAWIGKINTDNIIYGELHPLADLQARKQGAVFIGSHLGNLEVCRALGHGRYSQRINVLVFTHHAVEFNRVLNKINPDANVDLIQATEVGADLAILLKERVENGEIVVIVGDRTSVNSTGRVVYHDFLGQSAPFSQGPFILASLMDCPVYLLFCLKQGSQYRVIFEHISDSLKFSRKTRQQDLSAVVGHYTKRLEYYCLAFPFQWFNFFDFWHNDQDVDRKK